MVVEARQELVVADRLPVLHGQLHIQAVVETTTWKRETCDKTIMHGGNSDQLSSAISQDILILFSTDSPRLMFYVMWSKLKMSKTQQQ